MLSITFCRILRKLCPSRKTAVLILFYLFVCVPRPCHFKISIPSIRMICLKYSPEEVSKGRHLLQISFLSAFLIMYNVHACTFVVSYMLTSWYIEVVGKYTLSHMIIEVSVPAFSFDY